jgi:hypothetical protein
MSIFGTIYRKFGCPLLVFGAVAVWCCCRDGCGQALLLRLSSGMFVFVEARLLVSGGGGCVAVGGKGGGELTVEKRTRKSLWWELQR